MNELARRPLPHMTADDFLAWPGDGTGRTYQLVDGEVRQVSPASSVHASIQARLTSLITSAFERASLPLQITVEGAVIPGLNASTNVRVPDILVSLSEFERDQQTVPDPLLVVEVLSPGNQDDTRDNIRAYATLASVREMVVIHSTRVLAEVHRRDAAGAWLPEPDYIAAGGRLRLAPVALDCAIEDAYRGTWLLRPGKS
jgi:Uma2 family endonuclease